MIINPILISLTENDKRIIFALLIVVILVLALMGYLSYLLVKMIYGDDIWHNVTRTRGITGFTGPKGRPLDLTPEEVQRLRLEKIKVEFDLAPGDKVEIIEGPLDTMIGEVVSISADEKVSRAKVKVEMFGRETTVDLEYSQLRKIND